MLKDYESRVTSGSQCSFIIKKTAIAPFGAEHTAPQPISVGYVNVETESGHRIPISVFIVPFIAAPLNMPPLRASHTYMDQNWCILSLIKIISKFLF